MVIFGRVTMAWPVVAVLAPSRSRERVVCLYFLVIGLDGGSAASGSRVAFFSAGCFALALVAVSSSGNESTCWCEGGVKPG